MLRNLKETKEFNVTQTSRMAIIALFMAVIGSVFYGLILVHPLWYSHTMRWMLFTPLGYYVVKNVDYGKDNPTTWEKILMILLSVFVFSLLFLFVFGIVFAVPDIFSLLLSCAGPFAVGLIATTEWNFKKKVKEEDHSAECPYEVEAPIEAEKEEPSEPT